MKKVTTILLSAGLSMAMLVPAFAEDTIKVTVTVDGSTASEAGIIENGAILDGYVVEAAAGTTAVDILKKALDENKITYDIQASDYGNYISAIAGLAGYSNPSANPDYSGWMLEYNGDGFTNWGIDTLGAGSDGVLADGDKLLLDYSLYMGADLGTSSTPYLTTLTINDKTYTFTKEFKGYDESYAPVFEYLVDGEAISGTGTEEDPFTLAADLGKVKETSFAVSAKASSHYEIKDLADKTDFTSAETFTVESKYGLKAYFSVTAKYEAENDGDAAPVAPIAMLMISAMAVMVYLKKKEA